MVRNNVAFVANVLKCTTCTTARGGGGGGCTNGVENEVRAGKASAYGLSVPKPHVTSLLSH